MTVAPDGGERDPFSLTANPDGYVPTSALDQVLADALAALDAGNVPVIAGATGLGKTLVLQLIARARADRSRPLYVPFCTLGPDELATLAVGLLDRVVTGDPELQLLEEARKLSTRGQTLLLLVDDAAALPGETAAQLAHWLNASGGTLQMVLAGLPGPALRHARDCFGDRAEELLLVEGLKPEEIPRYVRVRLDAAAVDPEVRAAFDESALSQLARVSEGNPRRVNLAAQAIIRNVYGESAAQPQAAATEEAPSTARDLMDVGAYRFVRGRFVDPGTGEALAGAQPVPHIDETKAPPPRPGVRRPPVPYPDFPEADLEPDVASGREPGPRPLGTFDVFNRDVPPDQALRPPGAAGGLPVPTSPRVPLRWIAAGVVLLFLGIGLGTQIGVSRDDDKLPPPPAAAAKTSPEPAKALAPIVEVPPVVPEAAPEPAEPSEPAAEAAPERVEVFEPDVVEPEAAAGQPAPPAPEPAPAAPPPAETIAVAINATPWATIEIDGQEIGETPLAGIQLPTGRHRFKARMPDGSSRERVVRIDADNNTVVFE